MKNISTLEKAKPRESEQDPFDNITEEEIISLWECFKANGLSADEAWHAIVTGIALDMVFERSSSLKVTDQ
jgi:hypothetical protein